MKLYIGAFMVLSPLAVCLGVGVYEAVNGDTTSQFGLVFIAWMAVGSWLINKAINNE